MNPSDLPPSNHEQRTVVPSSNREQQTIAPSSNRDGPTLLPAVPSLGDAATVTGQAPPTPPTVTAVSVEAPPGYTISRELGRGGMGVVYLASQQGLNRPVALKMILGGATTDQKALIRFLAEAEAVASIKHPNVVEVFQFGEHQGRPFMALEFCSGGSLDAKVKAGRLEPRAAATILASVAEGVQAAHSQGMVHRDLKPHNVLLSETGEPKVTDFGLAKKIASRQELTRTDAVMGTPAYMSPEQAQGGTKFVGPPADVWSLGVMLYEMLSGEKPFVGEDTWSILGQVMKAEVVPLSKKVPGLPRDLQLIVAKCLQKEPVDRYPDAGHLASDLRAWLAGRAVSVRPVGYLESAWKWVRRNPSWAAMITLFVLTLLSATVISLNYARQVYAEQENTLRSLAYSTVLLAEATWNGTGSAGRVRELLASIPERFQNWEHSYLRRKFEGSFATLHGHRGAVYSVCFSPDGRRLASGSSDQSVRVWDVNSGETQLELKGHRGPVRSVCFSPDGSRLLSASDDGTIQVWNSKSGENLLELRMEAGGGGIWNAVFSPDGSHILSGKGGIRLWHAITGKLALEAKRYDGSSSEGVCFSPDGEFMAAEIDTGILGLWDAKTGQGRLHLRGSTGRVSSVALSPDGGLVLAGFLDGTARVWDSKSGRSVLELKGHTSAITSLSFSPDGVRLLSSSRDGTLRLWDARSGESQGELKGHVGSAWSAAFSPDGTRIVSAADDGTVRLWKANPPESQLQLKGHRAAVTSLRFSPDGTLLASTSVDGNLRLWDSASGRNLFDLKAPGFAAFSLNFSPTGEQIICFSKEGGMRAWHPTSGRSLMAMQNPDQFGQGTISAPRGSPVASWSFGGKVRLWDASSGNTLTDLEPMGLVSCMGFSPDGCRVVAGAHGGPVRVWDATTGRKLLDLGGNQSTVRSICFSPDGTRVLAGSADGTLQLWEMTTGRTVFKLAGLRGSVESLDFSPNGTRIVFGTSEGEVRVSDATSGQHLLELKRHKARVTSVVFSPDGTRIASGSDDHTIRLWDGDPYQSPVELKDAAGNIDCSPDGLHVITRSLDGLVRLWDARTGELISNQKNLPSWISNSSNPGAMSLDGKFLWLGQPDGRVVRIDLQSSREKLAFRRAMSRPDPIWHRQQLEAARKANDPFAAAVQDYLLHKATAEEHFDYNRFDQAFYWSVAAQLLKPKPPVIDWPELLPKPKG